MPKAICMTFFSFIIDNQYNTIYINSFLEYCGFFFVTSWLAKLTD